jgi:RNA polymerase sigma-70 factor (ECF subfamily)
VAFLVLLESLTPEQRAAFLLREVFDYPYAEIATIIGTGKDNTRQLVARARKHMDDAGPASRRHSSGVSNWRAASWPQSATATCKLSRSC